MIKNNQFYIIFFLKSSQKSYKIAASNGNNTAYGANNSSLFIATLQKVSYSLLSE